MCDTMIAFGIKRSFFAKNSDREPGELQYVYLSENPMIEFNEIPYIEAKEKYIQTSFKTLSSIFNNFEHPYKAIISRPSWMWGAEMGVNEFGLAIGNEAVFSKEKVNNQGLLGMDILRLALHNSKSAKDALNFIIDLIEEYGQGGDGGYRKSLKYHNSFLIKDFSEAYLLETSAKNWAYKKIDSFTTISNSYSISKESDLTDSNTKGVSDFKSQYENKLFTYFSKGDIRRKISTYYLAEETADLSVIKRLLRTHGQNQEKIKYGMGSICMHSGRLIKSETTSSLIVDYLADKFIVWFTASPHPCVSLFKPLIIQRNSNTKNSFTNINFAIDYSKKLTDLSKKLVQNYDYFISNMKKLRDEYESKFESIIYDNIEEITLEKLTEGQERCLMLEIEYLDKVKSG